MYFDSSGVEHIPKEIKKFIGHKNIKTNIYRIQVYDLIVCRLCWFGFIDFMFKGKSLTNFINLFSPNNFKNDHNVIFNYFLIETNTRKIGTSNYAAINMYP